jgi:thiamine monophosphate kinase
VALSEFDLIARYFSGRGARRDDVLLGIGDDAALLTVPAGRQLAAAVDTLVAGRHFPAHTGAFDIGWKALAVNLSDLAAMGATPAWATLSLTLPAVDEAWLQAFADGFFALADTHHVALVGGDTTRGPLSITVQAHGHVAPGAALRRDAAAPGQALFVSGTLGDAACALRQLQAGDAVDTFVLQRLNRPEPRVTLGESLAGVAAAAIDISDGTVADFGYPAASVARTARGVPVRWRRRLRTVFQSAPRAARRIANTAAATQHKGDGDRRDRGATRSALPLCRRPVARHAGSRFRSLSRRRVLSRWQPSAGRRVIPEVGAPEHRAQGRGKTVCFYAGGLPSAGSDSE